MQVKSPIRLDLNNLFRPAIEDGPQDLSFFQKLFQSAHAGTRVLKKTGHLPYALLPTDTIALTHIQDAAAKYAQVKNVVVLGIGGSALGLSAVYQALAGTHANLKNDRRLFVVDNIDPDLLLEVAQLTTAKDTLYVLISKSGETTETLAQYLYYKKHLPQLDAKNTFVITDPQKGFLRKLAREQNLPSLSVPPGVGGRFSVLTAVGLFPLAVLGVDIADILAGAEHMEERCLSDHLEQNPAGLLATTLHHWLRHGMRQVVLMPYSDRLRLMADWFAQLWAESLGKRTALDQKEVFSGSTPIKSVGVTDQHSLLQLYLDGPRDKVVLFLQVDRFEDAGTLAAIDPKHADDLGYLSGQSLEQLMLGERKATEAALRENGRPNATISLGKINAFELGQLLQMFMNMIPYLGAFENINPFDQPAVQKIKDYTGAILGRPGCEEHAKKLTQMKKREDLVF
jgi:glucose-6-phosphate isomerase